MLLGYMQVYVKYKASVKIAKKMQGLCCEEEERKQIQPGSRVHPKQMRKARFLG